MQKRISRGAEWCKFQLHSTFRQGVNGPQRMSSISVKTPDYSLGFLPESETFDLSKTGYYANMYLKGSKMVQIHSTF